jgi:hypothetical protein
MNINQQLFTTLSYEEKKTQSENSKKKVNRMIELRNISLLMVTVSLVSLSAINLDAITIYASDRLGMTQDIVQITQSEKNTTIVNNQEQ